MTTGTRRAPAPDFWAQLAGLDAADVASVSLDVDLAVYARTRAATRVRKRSSPPRS